MSATAAALATTSTANARLRPGRVLPAGCDAWLAATAACLLLFGLTMVLSASVAMRTDQPFHYFFRQCFAAVLGIALGLMALRTPLADVQRSSAGFLLLSFLMAFLVLLVGKKVNGSVRWLMLGPLSVQASEPIKLFVVFYLSSYLVRHREQVQQHLLGFLKPIVLITGLSGLLLMEPDLGATAVVFATTMGLLLMGGVPTLRFLAWSGVAIGALAALMVVEWYRMARLFAFMDPWSDPQDTGYQLVNSLMAFGRGGWTGVGLGGSVQKMLYLPEVHTDFIFAVIGEELGLIGTVTVILSFAFLVWRIFYIAGQAARAGHAYGAYLAYGIGLIIGLQAFINMGVNLGMLPTKGLTLPLISYGNNSMVVTLAALGLVLRVAHETHLINQRPLLRGQR
jgi:cell division protein FtsW